MRQRIHFVNAKYGVKGETPLEKRGSWPLIVFSLRLLLVLEIDYLMHTAELFEIFGP